MMLNAETGATKEGLRKANVELARVLCRRDKKAKAWKHAASDWRAEARLERDIGDFNRENFEIAAAEADKRDKKAKAWKRIAKAWRDGSRYLESRLKGAESDEVAELDKNLNGWYRSLGRWRLAAIFGWTIAVCLGLMWTFLACAFAGVVQWG